MDATAIERREVAVVALLGPFAHAVATGRRRAGLIRRVAGIAILEPTFGRASIVIGRVTVVALLEAGDEPIATFRGAARDARLKADPALFELAVGAATVRPHGVVVVALLGRIDPRVATYDRQAPGTGNRASKVVLDARAVPGAPVPTSSVAVVACLDRLTDPVAAIDRDVGAPEPAVASGAGRATGSTRAGSARGARCASRASRIHPVVSTVCPRTSRDPEQQSEKQSAVFMHLCIIYE